MCSLPTSGVQASAVHVQASINWLWIGLFCTLPHQMMCLQIAVWTVLTLLLRSWFVWHQCSVAKQQLATCIPHLVPLIFVVCINLDRLVLQTWERWLVIVHVPHMRSPEAVKPIWPYPLECGGLWQSFLSWSRRYASTDCGDKQQKMPWYGSRRWRSDTKK